MQQGEMIGTSWRSSPTVVFGAAVAAANVLRCSRSVAAGATALVSNAMEMSVAPSSR